MPEYNYVCESCGNKFMVERKISEYQSKEKCPCCQKEASRDMKTNYYSDFIVKCIGFYGKTSS